MNNFLQPIKCLLDMGVKTKSTYCAALEGMDQAMVSILDSVGYEYCERDMIPLERERTDVRLSRTHAKLAAFNSNKSIGLGDFVQYASDLMDSFLKQYYFGYCSEFSLNEFGCFSITISSLLHTRFSDNKASNKLLFEKQLATLAALGLIVKEDNRCPHYQFLDNDENRRIISEILIERGARMLSFKSINDKIREFSFVISAEEIVNFACDDVFDNLPTNENELNADEFAQLKDLTSQIPMSLSQIHYYHQTMEDNAYNNMVNTCGFVAESCFSQICEIVGYHGVIFQRIKNRFVKERSANMQIHELQKDIGAQFPVDMAKKTVSSLHKALNRFCSEKLHCVVRDFRIEKYIGRATIKWITNDYDCGLDFYDDNGELTIPDLNHTPFKTVSDFRNDCSYLVDNAENEDYFLSVLSDLPGVYVESFIGSVHDGQFTLKEFSVVVNDIAQLIMYFNQNKDGGAIN